MRGLTRRCTCSTARIDVRFHAARAQMERQGSPDDWWVEGDEGKWVQQTESPPGGGPSCSIVVVRPSAVRTCSRRCWIISRRRIRIAGHARFVRAGGGFRRGPRDVATVAWPGLGIARIAPGTRIGRRWCRAVTLGHVSSPVRTPRRGSPTACSRPAIPMFPLPPSHPSPASASSGSEAGNRRLR